MNQGKEGKHHGKKASLKNGSGARPAINNIKLPSFTHPKQISQVGEGPFSEILSKNISSLLGGWVILQWNHHVMH